MSNNGEQHTPGAKVLNLELQVFLEVHDIVQEYSALLPDMPGAAKPSQEPQSPGTKLPAAVLPLPPGTDTCWLLVV